MRLSWHRLGAGLLILGLCGLFANPVKAEDSPPVDRVARVNWIDPKAIERLKAVSLGETHDSILLQPMWQLGLAWATELSPEERDEVLATLDTVVRERLNQQGEPTLRLEVSVREVWRPVRLLNFFMFLLPIPGSGPLLSTRGGIVVETSLHDIKTGALVASFECRKRGDLSKPGGIFGRADDSNWAMRYCMERLLDAFTAGEMPSALPLLPADGTFSGG